MRTMHIVILLVLSMASCHQKSLKPIGDSSALPIEGTWKLITGTLINNGDTTITSYTQNVSFIKILNRDHFAFLQHDLAKGKDSATTVFVAGGGKYTFDGNHYTEELEYCSDRKWEGNSFDFTVTIKNDTLVQKGTEKIPGTAIDRINIEKYVRVK